MSSSLDPLPQAHPGRPTCLLLCPQPSPVLIDMTQLSRPKLLQGNPPLENENTSVTISTCSPSRISLPPSLHTTLRPHQTQHSRDMYVPPCLQTPSQGQASVPGCASSFPSCKALHTQNITSSMKLPLNAEISPQAESAALHDPSHP